MRGSPSIGLCVLSCLFSSVVAAKQPISASDLLKIGRVTEVAITPDARSAIFGVQTVHADPPASPGSDPVYKYRVNLWSCDLDDPAAKPHQLTYGDRSDTGLAISPDGRELAFLRADSKKHNQVWLLSLMNPGEARMLTELENGAANPVWRGDSHALLVTSGVPVSKLPGKPPFSQERPNRQWWDFARTADQKAEQGSPDGGMKAIRSWLEHNSEQNNPIDITRIAFLGELSLNGEITFEELFRVDLGPEPKTTQLTSTFRDHTNATYSPRADRIVFDADADMTGHPDRAIGQSVIWQMNADGSGESALLRREGFQLTVPRFTKDGQALIVSGSQNDDVVYRQTRLAMCRADGSDFEWLTEDGAPSAQSPLVAANGNVYYTINYHGGEPLLSVSTTGKHAKETLVDVPVGVTRFAMSGDKVVYAQVSAGNPNELYVARLGKSNSARRLTAINSTWLAEKEISLPTEHWVTRPDGTRIQYWTMPPLHAEKGRTGPWVLDMHGGPSAMWGPGEFSMWHEFQMFCAFGYGVVYSNPRGSSGYGDTFQRANYKDWGEGPMGDVMAALDDAIRQEPGIDTSHLFLTGGSYAGYLTAWMVGHTDRFKAAAAQRGVYDLATFFGEGNAFLLVPQEFGGYPWEPETRRLLERESPITYVDHIKTPLLILHGSSDNRTGVVQGQMLFRALKQLNRPVEYIRYPAAGHELTRSGAPEQRMDHMLRIIEFFERYTH